MRLITSTLLAGAVALGSVAPAFADPPRRGHGHDRHYDRDYRDGYRDGRRDDRRDYRRDYRDDRRDYRRWHKGQRFDHRTRYVYVDQRDYGRYHLRHPGRGERYVRTDTGEILLIAAATGLILWALTD